MILGLAEALRGNIDSSIDFMQLAYPTLRPIGKVYLIVYLINLVNHRYSSALITYAQRRGVLIAFSTSVPKTPAA